jgi:replicative DNA helicase Mcm
VSHYEKGQSVPDGGGVWIAEQTLRERIDDALAVTDDVARLRQLAESDIGWERIDTIEELKPDYEWVYDLEVEGTHTYIGNNVVSHNSQILQYVKKLAPRSVYTSGKGSSSAGLCVTGDTLIHTEEGFTPIRDIAQEEHPDPVTENTAAEREMGLYSFDRETGNIGERPSSHVWRMPEKPCRRIETAHGKELEASVNTPVLTCGDNGLEWKPISEVTAGEYVAAPKYTDIDRETPPIGDYIEYTNEKLRLSEDSIEFIRDGLRREFGTRRDAAAALELTEDFIYDSLSNRFLAQEKLDRLLEAIGATREDVTVRRAMLAHGSSVRIPQEFDEELLYLIGLVFGDGDLSLDARGGNRGMVRISNSDEALLERAAAIIERKFDRQVEIEYQEERVPCIRLNSATVARFFSNIGMESPKGNLELDSRLTTAEHADAFLRGLMDADGSVTRRASGSSSIQLSTISGPLAKQVQLMFETYGVAARRRRRDRRGEHTLENGYTIESKHVQHHLTVYGRHIDQYAETVGFEAAEKRAALETLVGTSQRREEKIPVGGALQAAEIGSGGGSYYMNFTRGDNPGRGRARAILDAFDLGGMHTTVEEAVDADLVWEEVTAAVDTGKKEVYDLTVPETHNFLGNGLVTHNTAAAVRDDFGEGQQWTLEAGALVLADQGVAAVDELDKMRSEDQSAMHQALEQQEISISKAGINATLKSRCSLLGAANPTYGRFDEYEPVGEQIDLEPPLISRFDLIFTVTDKPDKEKDQQLAEHIIKTNYAGELNTHRVSVTTSNVSQQEVDNVTEEVVPEIDPELLRKYVAYAKRNCYPTMTEEAKEAIRDFYVDMRTQGSDDSAVPVTARKLEALVRLAEASARIRLSDRVTTEDTDRIIAIVQSSLEDVGMDPETGELDADMVEAGTSKSQRDRIKNVKGIIRELQEEYEDGAPYDQVLERAETGGIERSKAEHEIQKLKDRGDIYEPKTDHLRVV